MASTKREEKARPRGHRPALAQTKSMDSITSARVEFALSALAASGKLKGSRTKRLSARVDPRLIKAARTKTGLNNNSELVNVALAVLAAPDDFGPWFVTQSERLPRILSLKSEVSSVSAGPGRAVVERTTMKKQSTIGRHSRIGNSIRLPRRRLHVG